MVRGIEMLSNRESGEIFADRGLVVVNSSAKFSVGLANIMNIGANIAGN